MARLRAAHLAAKNAQVSSMDRLVDRARGIFNHAHRFTTMGLIGLSGKGVPKGEDGKIP